MTSGLVGEGVGRKSAVGFALFSINRPAVTANRLMIKAASPENHSRGLRFGEFPEELECANCIGNGPNLSYWDWAGQNARWHQVNLD